MPHPNLKLVDEFSPIIDEVLKTGDILYIPPGCPHYGVSLNNSMSFSIGYQAPSSQELWSSFADKLIDAERGESRFSDPDRKQCQAPEQLSEQDSQALKSFMIAQLNDDDFFNEFLAKHLTTNHHPLELLIPSEPFTKETLMPLLDDDSLQLLPVAGIKSVIYQKPSIQLCMNSDMFAINETSLTLAKRLTSTQALTMADVAQIVHAAEHEQLSLLLNLLNKGYWYLDQLGEGEEEQEY